MTDEQSDLLLDIDDAIRWIYGEYGGVTRGRINAVRSLFDKLERTLPDDG